MGVWYFLIETNNDVSSKSRRRSRKYVQHLGWQISPALAIRYDAWVDALLNGDGLVSMSLEARVDGMTFFSNSV